MDAGHLLCMLSGPAPQRGNLENIFRLELGTYQGPFTLVCGKSDSIQEVNITSKDTLSLFMVHLPIRSMII